MMLKQVVLAHFEPWATGLGSWKIPKCLESGLFWDQKWVKNESKTRWATVGPPGSLRRLFPKLFPDLLGCSDKCF